MIKISNNTINVKDNYKSLKMNFVFDSIHEGLTHGNVFVNTTEDYKMTLVNEGVAFLFGGESDNLDDYVKVINYFNYDLLPDYKFKLAKIIYTSPVWEELLLKALQQFEPKTYSRRLYYHDLNNIPLQHLDKKVQSVIINDDLLSRYYENKKGLINELNWMWGSIENFCKNGFGFCGVIDDIITGWCTAEYMSKTTCGIGVETVEEFQSQGIATINTINLLKKCSELNITPHWDCWLTNVPSIKTAERCGFKKIQDYNVLLLNLNK